MFWVLLSLLHSTQHASCDCSNNMVMSVPVTDVVLGNNQVWRGVPIQVGTPAQNISMFPSAWLNDTWAWNTSASFCNWTSPTACTILRGGLYQANTSSTAKHEVDVFSAGGDPSDTQRAIGMHFWVNAWTTDVIRIGQESISSFPIGMPGQDNFGPYAYLGFGRNSTILRTLKATGKIASNSYSYWFGQAGAVASAHMDGQLVLGGYDLAKTSGANYTKALTMGSPACPSGMSVEVTDLVLNFPNGSDFSMISPGSTNAAYGGISACLAPDYPLIFTFPRDPYYINFEALSETSNIGYGGDDGVAFGGMIYRPGQVYEGDLTISLDNAISIRIANDLLVVPPYTLQQDGTTQLNQSVREVLMSATTGINSGDLATFGRDFFQAAYLTVDLDASTFTLWQVNATSTQNLRSLGPACDAPVPNAQSNNTSNATSAAPGANSSSTGASSPGNLPNSSAAHQLPSGSVIGISVGAATGVTLVGLMIILLLLRRRRRLDKVASSPGHDNSSELAHKDIGLDADHPNDPQMRPMCEGMDTQMHEMSARADPRELAADSKRHELASHGPVELM